MRQSVFMILFIFVFVPACATTPKVYEIQKNWNVPFDFEKTWALSIQQFAVNGWPMGYTDKTAGIITSDWFRVDQQKECMDCGSPNPFHLIGPREAKLNIFIVQNEFGSSLTLNTKFREARKLPSGVASRSDPGKEFYKDCNSTGALESYFRDQILSRK
jgi:hypothetical protein